MRCGATPERLRVRRNRCQWSEDDVFFGIVVAPFPFWELRVLGPPGAIRNRYKYLIAMIETLRFPTFREKRKFSRIIEVREWLP
jgi:hypothetical protein